MPVLAGTRTNRLRVVERPTPSGMERLVDDYMDNCRARNLSPKTLGEVYKRALYKVLLPFCERQGITEPSQLTSKLMDRLSSELLTETLPDRAGTGKPDKRSPYTVRSYARSVRSFLKWARKEGEAGEVVIQMPKVPKRVLDILSREEIQAMEDTATSERDKLVVRVLADTGVRVGELTSLRTKDLVEHDRQFYLRIHGKGDKERLVPIPRLHLRLRRYADRGRPKDSDSDRIFLGLRQRAGGGYAAIKPHAVEQMIRYLGQRAGIRKRVYPHLLRHSAATWMLRRGIQPMLVAQILGHSSLAMIEEVYAHLVPEDSYSALHRALVEE